ncbi:MAG: efflux RND transporter permease subunit, partial [Gemmataceae bacterium]|nr:efflux RND transporter permease subunit [Gemmataceae bacterium]
LLSFIPVFMLSGREGKLFHPLAFTKSFAMIGVALISVTLVPALIPTFIKGRLRSEEENWIVRSFINIYKPVMQWALPRRNLVMWLFAVLLILAAGMFPMQAVIGLGASHWAWELTYFATLFVVTSITVIFVSGFRWQVLSFVTLVLLGLWAYGFNKIGVEFMPALNEQTVMDMPITVPRASITQSADDLKARDALLRQFPELALVVNKVGRADTPTDPAPLDMVESFVTFRPRELWPKRAMAFNDASRQARIILAALEERGYVEPAPSADDRDSLINDVAMTTLAGFDEFMRQLALQRYREFEDELGPVLTRFVLEDAVRRFRAAGILHWPAEVNAQAEIDLLVNALAPEYGRRLPKNPALEDVTKLSQEAARHLAALGALKKYDPETGALKEVEPAAALVLKEPVLQMVLTKTAESLGAEPKTFEGEVLKSLKEHLPALWKERISKRINWELLDRGVEAFTWAALEEFAKGAKGQDLLSGAPHGAEYRRFAEAAAKARAGKDYDPQALEPFAALRQELEGPFKEKLFLWRRTGGPKGDLLQEMDTVIQVPGWSNIWTQPIQNRIDMLSTGVRTTIGVKVFGPDLETINTACKEIEEALKPIRGAKDVIAEPFMGKGYLEIKIDREKAARYGVSVGDIQDTIEVALGGRVITQTVEGRDRFPVRVRYALDFREDEEAVKRLLVSRSGMAGSGGMAGAAMSGQGGMAGPAPAEGPHTAGSEHAGKGPLQIPLSELAVVRIVEGPAMIKSENGRLRNYVTLNVRGDRDVVGFVEEAQRVVAEKVKLPEGVHLDWSGEFEHQVRAAKTLRVIFPAVIVLIFVILYLTYKDFVDACLMMLAVPEALAGGIFFQWLFPKIKALDWSAAPEPFSVAIWVGYIAAFGMATETGIIVLVYLREAIDKRGGLENIQSLEELRQTVIEGAVHRLRPKLLTEGVAIVAIAPMLFATGVGSEIISAMALPVLGGLLIADEVVDIFLPVRFYWVRRARWLKLQQQRAAAEKRDEPVVQARAAAALVN